MVQVGTAITNAITNGVGGVGTLKIDLFNTVAFSGVISDGAMGQLRLTNNGLGTTILTNTNTYTGETDVNAGTLKSMARWPRGAPSWWAPPGPWPARGP